MTKDKSISELTRNQYEILVRMDTDWSYPYKHFDDTKIDIKVLKKEMKILRELGFVTYDRGLLDDEGMAAGSGHSISYKSTEVSQLIEGYENKHIRNQKPQDKSIEIFEKKYCSEDLYDLERDVSEAIDENFNEKIKELPTIKEHPDFIDGFFKVTIKWKLEE